MDVFVPFQYSLPLGSAVKVVVGCDKIIKTCANKFCNAINFRGEPFVPNVDKVL